MFYTKAGKHFSNLITRWLQDTRLVAEACYRQSAKYDENPDSVTVTHDSWKKRSRVATDGPLTPKDFSLTEPAKGEHIHALLNQMLASQFILLETLWEAYLSELSIELSTISPAPFATPRFIHSIASSPVFSLPPFAKTRKTPSTLLTSTERTTHWSP